MNLLERAFHGLDSSLRVRILLPTAVLFAIIGFVASFAISLGPVMWVMLSEIFPNQYRGMAMSLAGFWNSAISASITFIFPWELSHFGTAGTFLGYGLMAVATVLFVVAFIPETKGKTLEEVRALTRAFKAMMSIHESSLDGGDGDAVHRRHRDRHARLRLHRGAGWGGPGGKVRGSGGWWALAPGYPPLVRGPFPARVERQMD